jgi:hypothetical protein
MKDRKRTRKRLMPISLMLVFALLVAGLGLGVAPAGAATQSQINSAIDDGLQWLADNQNPNGSWGSSYQVGRGGQAILALEEQAGLLGISPLDATYPYSQNVEDGLDYIFNLLQQVAIGNQTAGDPDTNGNGIGIRVGSHPSYETGIALMAICASQEPTRVVTVGPQTGRTYADVAQDMVDYFAWAQNEHPNSRGAWDYNPNTSRGDQSVAGFITLGLGYAAASPPWGFGLTVPAFVWSELETWIDYVQIDAVGTHQGGAGYTSPYSANIYRTGHLLYMMHLVGDTEATARVQDAVDYMERHWNDANPNPGWKGYSSSPPNYQACYTAMKGFRGLDIDEIDVGGPMDWYDDMADIMVSTQNADGSWPQYYNGDTVLNTAWAVLTLQRAIPAPPPPPPPSDGGCLPAQTDVSSNPVDGGMVTPESGKYCWYTTFTAVPDSGYEFTNWTINGTRVETANPLKLKILSGTTVVANFASTAPQVASIEVAPTDSTVAVGETRQYTATGTSKPPGSLQPSTA